MKGFIDLFGDLVPCTAQDDHGDDRDDDGNGGKKIEGAGDRDDARGQAQTSWLNAITTVFFAPTAITNKESHCSNSSSNSSKTVVTNSSSGGDDDDDDVSKDTDALSSSSFDGISSSVRMDINNVFIPIERRRRLSVKEVQMRLSSYAEQAILEDHNHDGDDSIVDHYGDRNDDDDAMIRDRPSECFDDISTQSIESSTSSSTHTDTTTKNQTNNNIDSRINRHTNTVLYYCACLVGTMPGTLYLTSTNILISSSTLFSIRPKREVFALTALHRSSLPMSRLKRHHGGRVDSLSSPSTTTSSITSSAISMLSSNTLTLSFQEDSRRFVDVLISPLVIDCAKLQMIIMEVKSAFHNMSTDIDGF